MVGFKVMSEKSRSMFEKLKVFLNKIQGKLSWRIRCRKPSLLAIIFVTGILVLTSAMLFINLVNHSKTVGVHANQSFTKTVEVHANQSFIDTEKISSEIEETTGELTLLQPFELSSSNFTLGDKLMTLKLLMSQGVHVTNGDIGPYGNDYYHGNLIGEVYDDQGKLVFTTDMSKYFTESLIFRNKFDLHYNDYNEDGLTDFIVGQYVGSNYSTFNIFTIKDNGEIVLLPVENQPDGIMCSKFDDCYSTEFTKIQDDGMIVQIYDMATGKIIEKKYIWKVDKFITVEYNAEAIKTKNVKIKLKDGSLINSNDLIARLDKTSDETIMYVYNKLPNNIKLGNIYEGDFSGLGQSEILVIFKFYPPFHAAGLDFSVAAIYERKTLKLISQKSFANDECKFDVLRNVALKAYLIYSGTTTYQGYSTGTLQLFNLSNNWEEILPQENSIYYNSKYKFELFNGGVCILSPEFSNLGVVEYKKKYLLKWDGNTSTLNDFIPNTFYDANGSKYYDVSSVSPNGRYAIVSHEWGFDEGSYILIYDTVQNKLVSKYDILAKEFGYVWSQDSKKVGVIRTARTWIDTCIVDIKKSSLVSIMDDGLTILSQFKALGVKFNYELDENRPDPYYQICEWSPDSKKVLMFYQWSDTDGNRQSGNFVYDLDKHVISKITQNKPVTEGGNLETNKPKGFKW